MKEVVRLVWTVIEAQVECLLILVYQSALIGRFEIINTNENLLS